MATTTKKSPAKKAAPKKTTAKTSVNKKAPVKATAKKTPSKSKATAKQAELRSFRIAKDTQPFTSFQITRQTIYWIILVSFIIFVQLWILKLQIEVAMLLDAQQVQMEEL